MSTIKAPSRRPKAKRTLAFVERAYRGALEEQYGHILWLSRVVQKMGGDTRIVLMGEAVFYAKSEQKALALTLGDVHVAHLSHAPTTIADLKADGVQVFVNLDDCRRYAIDPGSLLADIEGLEASGIAALCDEADCIFYW